MNRQIFRGRSTVSCRWPAVVLCAVFWLLAAVGSVQAEEPRELEGNEAIISEEEWTLALTPYAWFAAQSTDVGGTALRQSFNDLASMTNMGGQMRLAAKWRWLLLSADVTVADMQSENTIGRTSIDLGIDQLILDLKFGVKVHDTRNAGQEGGMAVWIGAGGRYWDNTVDYTITTQPILPDRPPEVTFDREIQRWWDPVLGLTFHFPVTPKVGFAIRATGGGFGIGDASDYLWDAETAALFRLSKRLGLSVGYRQFKYSRTDGAGDDKIEQTVNVSGPAIGLAIALF